MPFEKVETQVDFPAQERAILEFWTKANTFEKLRAKNRGKPIWSFLDGPITANNPMGVHHAWGRTYKDVYNRYFAMIGRELRYQQGFDCQGLWVEVEVEKELGLGSKRDIENLVPGDRFRSIDRFVQLCKDRVDRFARVQTDQSIRLGYWMDWDVGDADWAKPVDDRKSYFTMSSENNYTIWAFLKKCHDKGLIYRGYDVMPWCGRCGVGISEMEQKEGYRLTEHKSVFVKFPLKDRPGENLLVWTTTPWTLTSNVGAAVNPNLTYLKVRLKGEVYYVAKGAFKFNRMESSGADDEAEPEAAGGKKGKRDWIDGVPHLKTIEQMFKEKAGKEGFEIAGEVKGADMIGWPYSGPCDDLPAQQNNYGFPAEVARVVQERGWSGAVTAAATHRVIPWGDVGEKEGTGIVHIAPGCGREDFELGKEHGLPPVAPLDEAGTFVGGFGPMSDKVAYDPATADVVFERLKQTDRLFATERYVHKYPHCWRCKTELLFRLVDEWFIHMGPRETDQGFRGDIMKVVDQVTFLPESINGRARERDWLRNMGDWMISKKRFWGLALPIWVDEVTGDFEVIGSMEELKARAIEGWSEFEGHSPHRPWVDRVVIRNPKTGNRMTRISDVGNPWLDAGIVAFSTVRYNTDRAYWRKWYPADFITESFPGQFRNWFYALLAMSTMMSDGEPPFRTLLGFATVRDQFGKPMHKSDGNAIDFIDAANNGYELFHDIGPEQDAKVALADLPKGYLATREQLVTIKGEKHKRVFASYKPIGADVIRWFYCRFNPVSDVNFGPEPADEVRARFIIKLWNVYAFFCNYARLDGFDPSAPRVPVAERPDIDRWILSDLQLLITKAREAYESFNVMAFCLDAERFVDDKLSNWYVRRNRRRFWKGEKGRDKDAAYQTLYEVLTTLAKLIAPVVPFLAESIWRNLRTEGDAESVHLCEFPAEDTSKIDSPLSADMEALFDLVTLGSAARNTAKVKVRQPLAELKIQPGNDRVQRALARFADQLCEELNIRKATLHDAGAGPLLRIEVKPNNKRMGPSFGPRLKEVQAAIAAADHAALADKLRAGPAELACPNGPVMLDPADVIVGYVAPEGWVGAAERGTQVMLDVRITEDLARAGQAREVVRHVQELRRQADLELEDRIELACRTEAPALREAIESHRDFIAAETLTIRWAEAIDGDLHRADVKVDGHPLAIALRKTVS